MSYMLAVILVIFVAVLLNFILVIFIAVLLKFKLKFSRVILATCAATFTLVFTIFTITHLVFQYPAPYRVERRLIDAISFVKNYETVNNTFPRKDDFDNWSNRVYPNWAFVYTFYLPNGNQTENWSQKILAIGLELLQEMKLNTFIP